MSPTTNTRRSLASLVLMLFALAAAASGAAATLTVESGRAIVTGGRLHVVVVGTRLIDFGPDDPALRDPAKPPVLEAFPRIGAGPPLRAITDYIAFKSINLPDAVPRESEGCHGEA